VDDEAHDDVDDAVDVGEDEPLHGSVSAVDVDGVVDALAMMSMLNWLHSNV